MIRAAGLALALALVGCRPPLPPPRAEAAPAARLAAAPAGVDVDATCTPTGVERCFDAVDDNCNGVIDEGCGLHTGLVQFAAAWSAPADVDLVVTDPAGQTPRPGEATASGVRMDRACSGREGDGCHGQSLENVFYDGEGPPPRGTWRVVVRLARLDQATPPVLVRLGARVGGRSFDAKVALAASGDERAFAFEW